MNHHVHHFDMGLWLLFLAYIVSVTGSVVGLACTRQSAAAFDGRDRLRWLAMASIAIGGGGNWVVHFFAVFGFAPPQNGGGGKPWWGVAAGGGSGSAGVVGAV